MKKLLAGVAFALAMPAHAVIVINKPDFSDVSDLTINNDAAQVGNVLRVTPALDSQAGSAFSTTTVSLSADASFSTFFQFQFTDPDLLFCDSPTTCGADGLVFVVQTVGNNVGGAGGGIGYAGIDDSVGIEFDTWNNGFVDNNSSNHVGINIDGSQSSTALAEVTEADMNDGDVWNAWVDYDGSTDTLEARLTRDADRPASALVSLNLDLPGILGVTDAFMGFTSGTGASHANHDVLTWIVDNTFAPIDPDPDPDPDPNQLPAPGSMLLVATLLLGIRRFTARR